MRPESEGVPTRSLLGAFFLVVLLCAVFCSLGYFLGYRQGRASGALPTEQVASPSDVPPSVNPGSAADSGPQPSPGSEGSASAEPVPSEAGDSGPPVSATGEVGGQESPNGADEPAAPSAAVTTTGEVDGRTPAASVDGPIPSGLLVQVAALSDQRDATNVVSVLKTKGYRALVLAPRQARAKDGFFRVVAGPYKTRTEADKALAQLAAEGFKPFIRQ